MRHENSRPSDDGFARRARYPVRTTTAIYAAHGRTDAADGDATGELPVRAPMHANVSAHVSLPALLRPLCQYVLAMRAKHLVWRLHGWRLL